MRNRWSIFSRRPQKLQCQKNFSNFSDVRRWKSRNYETARNNGKRDIERKKEGKLIYFYCRLVTLSLSLFLSLSLSLSLSLPDADIVCFCVILIHKNGSTLFTFTGQRRRAFRLQIEDKLFFEQGFVTQSNPPLHDIKKWKVWKGMEVERVWELYWALKSDLFVTAFRKEC